MRYMTIFNSIRRYLRSAFTLYNQEGLGGLLAGLESHLTYMFKYYLFGLERALLTDRQWFRYTVWRNQRGVDAAADPRELRYVDPTEIRRKSAFNSRFCFRKFGAVRGGDWDINSRDLSEWCADIWGALEARYVDGKEWEDVELVQEVLAGNQRWRYATEEDIWEWVADLDEVYNSIREDGYRSARDIHGVSFDEAAESSHDSLVDRFLPVTNESIFFYDTDDITILDWLADIQVDIGRDGEVLQHNGRHRLWFAQHFGIDEIPVCVVVRHEEWQELRDEIANATSREELSDRARRHLDHPDMIDVVGSLNSSDDDGDGDDDDETAPVNYPTLLRSP